MNQTLTKEQLKAKIRGLEDEAWELLFVDCVNDFSEPSEVLETLIEETNCWLEYYRQTLLDLDN